MKRLFDFIDILFYPLLFIIIMWMVFLSEIKFGYDLTSYGVFPRNFEGLRGVVLSPFLHSDLKHITNNTLTFFVLSIALRFFFKSNFLKIVVLGILLSGSITWLIGREAYHVGMSGVIYMLAGFIIAKGIFSKNYHLLALTFLVVFLYGGLIWYVFPIIDGVSWEGHLAGLISGVLLSFFFKTEIKPKEIIRPPLSESQILFLEHFDEKGKFVPNLPFLDENGELIIQEEE